MEGLRTRLISCHNCPMKCGATISVPGLPTYMMKCFSKLTYTMAAMSDLEFGLRIAQKATEYGVDGFSAPQVMAFALELREAGFAVEDGILGRPGRWRRTLAELRGFDALAALDHNNLLRLLPAVARALPPYVVLFHVPVPATRPPGWLRAMRRAYAVVAVAEAQIAALDLPPECRIVVIPNGVRLPETPSTEDKSRAREELGLPAAATVAATACRLTTVKGVDVLIEALATLPEAERPFLAVAGGGPEETRLEALAGEKLGGAYKFAGVLRDVTPLYRAADIFVLSSYREAMPMALIEAMSHGLPVIAGDVGDVGVILGGGGGTALPPGETEEFAAAIRKMASSPARRLEYGALARATVAGRYTVRHMVDGYEALFREIAAGGDSDVAA
jgi:glycosyltransferase involved in cell wall biosynthesis